MTSLCLFGSVKRFRGAAKELLQSGQPNAYELSAYSHGDSMHVVPRW
jgi:hypothetical protein